MKPQQRAIIRRTQGTVVQAKVQEAIRLLGMSSLELANFVKTELAENPLLTEGEFDTVSSSQESPEDRDDSDSDIYQNIVSGLELIDNNNEDWQGGDIPEFSGAKSENGIVERLDLIADHPQSLHETLVKQVLLENFNSEERAIAFQLIENTDEVGYLRIELEKIASICNVSTEKVERVLSCCQNFEPTGVMARDLQECYKLQLVEMKQFGKRMELVIDNLERVASKDWESIKSETGLEREDVQDAVKILKQLSSRPFDPNTWINATNVTPDVIVGANQDKTYSVDLNPEAFPNVFIDQDYVSQIKPRQSDANLDQYIETHTSRANWLIEAINRRAITILRVAIEIVYHQTPYLRNGLTEFKALTARQVAKKLALHESTISRAIADKFIATPRGTLPFNFFFSRATVSTSTSEDKSSQAVKEQIKLLISAESPRTILSDNQIAIRLKQAGTSISRRTVTKYRETLGIPSSNDRRRLLMVKQN